MADLERERVTALWREALDALDNANEGITEQATLKLAALDRAEEAERSAYELMEARDNWHTAYVAERKTAARLREQLAAARQALERIRVVYGDKKLANGYALDSIDAIARAALGVVGEADDE